MNREMDSCLRDLKKAIDLDPSCAGKASEDEALEWARNDPLVRKILGLPSDARPVVEIRCPKCGHTFDPRLLQCPHCANKSKGGKGCLIWIIVTFIIVVLMIFFSGLAALGPL